MKNLVVCIVTPTDAIDTGQPVPSNSLVIANSPPAVSGATITPTVGGKLTEFCGRRTIFGGEAVATNGHLLSQTLELTSV